MQGVVDEACVLEDLSEDFATAWVPDPLRGVDFAALVMVPNAESWRPTMLKVPRPSRGPMQVPVLDFATHVCFREASRSVASLVEGVLRPEVCGYRAGASRAFGYQDEYQRFRDFLSAGIDDYSWAATTDVESFFGSVQLDVVLRGLRAVAPTSRTEALESVLREFQKDQLPVLPAGYADARMLANLLLAPVDSLIATPYTRWVDDFRLFSDDREFLHESLIGIGGSLAGLGLHVNVSKTRIFSRDDARHDLLGLDLASAFHPESESPSITTAELQRVFVNAITGPKHDRRSVRFCLPRLGLLGDDFAVDYALQALRTAPWEAPRLVHYLSLFRDRAPVRTELMSVLADAACVNDDWLVARVCAGVAGMRLAPETSRRLAEYVSRTSIPPVWALALRTLSLSGSGVAIDLAPRRLDVRAAIASYRDLGERIPTDLVAAGATTARVLERFPVPTPSPASLL